MFYLFYNLLKVNLIFNANKRNRFHGMHRTLMIAQMLFFQLKPQKKIFQTKKFLLLSQQQCMYIIKSLRFIFNIVCNFLSFSLPIPLIKNQFSTTQLSKRTDKSEISIYVHELHYIFENFVYFYLCHLKLLFRQDQHKNVSHFGYVIRICEIILLENLKIK